MAAGIRYDLTVSPTRWIASLVLVLASFACAPGSRSGAHGDATGSGSGSDATGPGCVGLTCSDDLKNVVDCAGNVVMSCPAGQGCAEGACVDACMAAAVDRSSIGCDYYTYDPDLIIPGGCFAAYLANTSAVPVSIHVDYKGAALPVSSFARIPTGQGQHMTYSTLPGGMLPPSKVAILFLADQHGMFIDCPAGITPAVTATDAAVHGTGFGSAFHITTSAPVVAYDIAPYGGGNSAITSATLLLPTSVWDTNYLAVDAYPQGAGQPTVNVVAQKADTHVTIRPVTAIDFGMGIQASPPGIPQTYTLEAGQVLQFTQSAELAGSPITSDQPIGVWGGASCMFVPTLKQACDGAHQQIPPVEAMGSRYMAVRYRNRFVGQEESVPWRFVGAVDGTLLTYVPSAPSGAPTTLAKGEVVEIDSPGQFTVQSQDADHPFYMSAYMTGCEQADPGLEDCRGDPEYVNIVPPEQYLREYTFFTDPTYPETNLVLAREKHNGSFADVTVDCAGVVTGWTAIDAADTMEYARLDLVTGNFHAVGSCNNGLHTASSAQPFGLVVWGWGSAATGPANTTASTQAVSYAYPAGARIRLLNTVVIQ
jgi:hypothetical protein